MGGTNLAVAVREREPLQISCADYVAEQPTAHWLRLTECTPDLDHVGLEITSTERHGVHVNLSDHVTAAFIPLRPLGTTTGRPHIVVRRTDPSIIYLVTHGRDDASYDANAARVLDSFREPTQGLIEVGSSWSDERREDLDTLRLASDAVLIEADERPPFVFALVVCVVGLGAALWLASLVRGMLANRGAASRDRPAS